MPSYVWRNDGWKSRKDFSRKTFGLTTTGLFCKIRCREAPRAESPTAIRSQSRRTTAEAVEQPYRSAVSVATIAAQRKRFLAVWRTGRIWATPNGHADSRTRAEGPWP